MADTPPLTLFPFDTAPQLDGEPVHARLRAEGPVARVRLADGTLVWVALSHDAVRTVLIDSRFSRAASAAAGSPTITPGIDAQEGSVNLDPPEHTRHRRLVAGAFTARVLEGRRPRIQTIADELLDAMAEHGPPADLVAALAFPLPITVLCDLLGMPYEDVAAVSEWSEITQSSGGHPYEEVARAFSELGTYLARLIAAKRRQPDEHLLTQLIDARDRDDRLTEPELLGTAMGLILAGHETTANLMAVGLLTLLRHPDQVELLRARPELVPGAVEEVLRYTRLLVSSFGRVATADVDFGGVTIPAGDTVFALHAAANRDERLHADPERFDVTRTGPPHVSFGLGPHLCLGAPLARIELQVGLGSLLRRFPGLELAVPESALEWRVGNFIRGVHALPVRW